MKLKIDLISQKKKTLFLVFGTGLFLIASARIVIYFFGNEAAKPFDWIYFGIFALQGLFFVYQGLEEAYLLINSELILLKNTLFEKKLFVAWNEVKSVNYRINRIEFVKTDDTIMTLYFETFNYASVQKIKETIAVLAKEKNKTHGINMHKM